MAHPGCRLGVQSQPLGVVAKRPPCHRNGARKRLRPCRAGPEEASDGPPGLLGQAVRWTADAVRSGLARQAATAGRWRQGEFSRQQQPGQPAGVLAEPPDPAGLDRAAAASASGGGSSGSSAPSEESEDERFRLLPQHVPRPPLAAPFSDWEEYYTSMDTAGNWQRVFVNMLHEAIEADDFQHASVFRDYLAQLEQHDTVGQALVDLEEALQEEDYQAAAAARDRASLQYKGWWYGSSSGDTEAHLLRVEACYGRLGGFWVSLADIVGTEEQREGSMLRAVTQAHREIAGTGSFVIQMQGSGQAAQEEEPELELATCGMPCMEVWPSEPGTNTATALDAPIIEVEGETSGWSGGMPHAEILPGGGLRITAEAEITLGPDDDSGTAANALGELISRIGGLMEGMKAQAPSEDGSQQPRVISLRIVTEDSSPSASSPDQQQASSSGEPAEQQQQASSSFPAMSFDDSIMASLSGEEQAEALSRLVSAQEQAQQAEQPEQASTSGRDENDASELLRRSMEAFETISAPEDTGAAESFQAAMRAVRAMGRAPSVPPDEPPDQAAEDGPAFPEDASGGFTRRPAEVFPISHDRFVLHAADEYEPFSAEEGDEQDADGDSEAGYQILQLGEDGSSSSEDEDAVRHHVMHLDENEVHAFGLGSADTSQILQQPELAEDVRSKVDMILGLLGSNGRQVNSSFRGKLENFLKEAVTVQSGDMAAATSLQGAVNYQRLTSPAGPQDPYTGLFLAIRECGGGRMGLHTALLQLQRGSDQEGRDSVTATKLMGEDAMAPGTVVFKAAVDRRSRQPLDQLYDEDLGVQGRHAAAVRWDLDAPPPSSQWSHGQLLDLSESSWHKANMALVTHQLTESADMIWMSRITLPDVE